MRQLNYIKINSSMYNYGIIGNCSVSALIHENGGMDWLCLPRPDSPPVFGKLLDTEGGSFGITSPASFTSRQEYVPNTNILRTILNFEDGSSLCITDFAPRFMQHGRIYRPLSLFRSIEPLSGSPRIKITCQPVSGWPREAVPAVRGNSHLRFEIRGEALRITTNMPLTYLLEQQDFQLKDPIYFGLTWSFGIEEDLISVFNQFLRSTQDYWDTWVKHCGIPTLYQEATIRSALALKLHCYEDTGAILAALTTSLPEEAGRDRNWDYRFCWLRDAYYVLNAFHSLGHFEEMESFIKFALTLVEQHEKDGGRLRPVYRLDQTLPLPEETHPNWGGFAAGRPVRSGNQAADHEQNDVFGELALSIAPIYFDERFRHLRTPDHDRLLRYLANRMIETTDRKDAGLWELRNGWQVHSFSNLMNWAGLERVSRIRGKGYLTDFDPETLKLGVDAAYQALRRAVVDGSLRNGPKDASSDSALLQLPIVNFPDLDLCGKTLEHVRSQLTYPGFPAFLYRYARKDDFGKPSSAFVICSFWQIRALAFLGRKEEARQLMQDAMKASNALGLFSEHFDPVLGVQLGNFPQAYSHVGQINAAFAVSPTWDEVL